MKLALQINNYMWDGNSPQLGATLTKIVQTADEWGFSSIAVADHLWAVPPWMGPIEGPVPECYTTLAYLAASTRHVELIALATPPHFRYPALLAKMISTLDVLSCGATNMATINPTAASTSSSSERSMRRSCRSALSDRIRRL